MAMSQQHKDALARGRKEAKAITAYLDALAGRRRGRPVTEASVKRRLDAVRDEIGKEGNSLRRVELTQKQMDLEQALRSVRSQADHAALENGFIRYAAGYSERKGISYAAWRSAGVPAAVLVKAGIRR
jgi:hypothetical protein